MMECPCTYYIGLTVRTDHQLSLCYEINHCDTMSCTGLTITMDCPSIWCTPCFTVRTDVILSIALETNRMTECPCTYCNGLTIRTDCQLSIGLRDKLLRH